MSNAFRAEWARLLRPRSILGLAVPLVAFPALLTVLSFLVGTRDSADGPAQHISTTRADLVAPDGYLVGIKPASMLLGVVVMVFFAVTFGADATHGTLRNLLVREPRRARLLAGRLLALTTFTAAGMVLALVAAVVAAWAAARGYDVGTGGWDGFATRLPGAWAALAVAGVGWGTVGALLGIALRPTTTAVAVGAVWALLVESIAGEVWSGAARWLPAAAFNATAARGTADISMATGIGLVAAYSAAAAVAAAWALSSRDVLV